MNDQIVQLEQQVVKLSVMTRTPQIDMRLSVLASTISRAKRHMKYAIDSKIDQRLDNRL